MGNHSINGHHTKQPSCAGLDLPNDKSLRFGNRMWQMCTCLKFFMHVVTFYVLARISMAPALAINKSPVSATDFHWRSALTASGASYVKEFGFTDLQFAHGDCQWGMNLHGRAYQWDCFNERFWLASNNFFVGPHTNVLLGGCLGTSPVI